MIATPQEVASVMQEQGYDALTARRAVLDRKAALRLHQTQRNRDLRSFPHA